MAANVVQDLRVNSGILEVNQLSLLPHLQLDAEAIEQLNLWAAIAAEVRRLGWPPEQVSSRLCKELGGRSQAELTDLDLRQWLKWLQSH